jgi:hypothetical protein
MTLLLALGVSHEHLSKPFQKRTEDHSFSESLEVCEFCSMLLASVASGRVQLKSLQCTSYRMHRATDFRKDNFFVTVRLMNYFPLPVTIKLQLWPLHSCINNSSLIPLFFSVYCRSNTIFRFINIYITLPSHLHTSSPDCSRTSNVSPISRGADKSLAL